MKKSRVLPKNWEVKKFEDVLDYIQPTKFIVKSTEYHNSYDTPVLTAGKTFILGRTNELDGIFNNLPVIIFDDFTTANKFVNFPFKVKSSAMKILKPKKNVNIKFVHYYMQTVRVTFDTHKRYWISVFAKEEMPYPPLSEQQSIVQKIEELFSELDKSIENLKTAQQQIKTYRQSVLKSAFEGKLTSKKEDENLMMVAEPNLEYGDIKLPNNWKYLKLRDLGEWKGGGTPSKRIEKYWTNGDVLWVSSKDMKFKVINDSIDKITSEAIGNSSAKIISEGALLFVMRSGILRHTFPVAIAGKELTVNQDLQTITPNDSVISEFLYWYIINKNQDIREKCSKDGTTVESIDSISLKEYQIPIPTLNEQKEIISEIESRFSVADKLEESINQSLLQAETLRQSILKRAFEGKLI